VLTLTLTLHCRVAHSGTAGAAGAGAAWTGGGVLASGAVAAGAGGVAGLQYTQYTKADFNRVAAAAAELVGNHVC
jgi:hypothetical protein